ncbi:MAG TPA: type II toxin-antitoxin system VapC family toxin [Bryobacterales bacterium]|nr:type II toxin-antitoxin system VapC family toxin [Bryobacterales bacterium]
MRILLDTNRLTDAFRGVAEVVQILEQAAEIWIPFVALAEIKTGFLGGRRAAENEGLLHAFLRLPGVAVLFADEGTTDAYARLFLQLRRAGTPVPTNDLWIASLAVQHQLVLLSRDQHFAKLPQVSKS